MFLEGLYLMVNCSVLWGRMQTTKFIVWEVVCVENKENWKWFIDLLINGLNLDVGQGLNLS